MLPTRGDYKNALNSLSQRVIPPELKPYQPIMGQNGTPTVYSGGFALTCPIEDEKTGTKKALRMFERLPDKLEARYVAISEFINAHMDSGIFTHVKYVREGIVIDGNKHPICYMDWVEGTRLDKYIGTHYKKPAKMEALAAKFDAMLETLRSMGAAHGDLSLGNIIVMTDDSLMLLDYDGMFIPKLRHLGPCVAGAPSYQHPERMTMGGYFGEYQDNFSAIVFYIMFRALALEPALYAKYKYDNNLLFTPKDYQNPDTSPIMREMEAHAELKPLIAQLRTICKASVKQCPTLRDFRLGKTQGVSVILAGDKVFDANQIFTTEGSPIFAAWSVNQELLMRFQGNTGTLVGFILGVRTENDAILCEFSSGGKPASVLYLIDGAFAQLQAKGANAASIDYASKWVKVTGVIQTANIKGELVPSIEIDNLDDIKPLDRETATRLVQGREADTTDLTLEAPIGIEGRVSQPPLPAQPRTVDDLFKPKYTPTSTQPAAKKPAPPDEQPPTDWSGDLPGWSKPK